jgi:hypothetical protein
VPGALLILVNLVLYRKVLRLWWTYDDANILHTVASAGFGEPFVNGDFWPQQLFTPLLMTAFQAQLVAFGADARLWYIAQLTITCLATLAVYAACRMYLKPLPAFSAAMLFAAGAPLCSVVTQLSTVHYLLAVILAALATMAFTAAARRRSLLLAGCSALLYLGAMLAKEVALPLPLVLLVLPAGESRVRARLTIGHWVALAGYVIWRRAVIGAFFGAYGWVIKPADWPRLLAFLPWRVIRAAAGTNPWLGIPLVLGMIGLVVLAVAVRSQRRDSILLLAAAVVLAMAPLLPVAKEVNRRYVLIPWLLVSIAFAAAASTLLGRRRTVVLLLAPMLALMVNRQEWGREFGTRQRMSDESRVFFELPPNGLLRQPATPPAVMRELNWLKIVYLGKPAGASWFYDDFFLCTHGSAGKRVWQFDPAILTVVEITPRIAAIERRHCGSIRSAAPLTARFHFQSPELHWDLGPYADGKYTVLLGDGWEVFEVPRKEALNLPSVTGLALRVRYDSPQGWTTYSDQMTLDFTKHSDFAWQR